MTITARHALQAALRDDIDRFLDAEPEVRRDADDSVHQMRVATRRLRSVLRSYQKVFAGKPAAEMGERLRRLGGVLGAARDAEVRAARFEKLLAEHAEHIDPADLAAVTARLVTRERDRYRAAHDELLRVLDSKQYQHLRTRLRRWRTDPPLRRAAAEAYAEDLFEAVLRHDSKRVEKLVRVEPSIAAPERITLLHDIRKSAKRLRYSCEAAQDVLGERAAELGSRAKRLQTVLGEHRDAVEAHEAILVAAAEAAAAGENTTPYTLLAAAEDAAAGRALSGYPATAAALFEGTDRG